MAWHDREHGFTGALQSKTRPLNPVSAFRCLTPEMTPGTDDGSDGHPLGFPFPRISAL